MNKLPQGLVERQNTQRQKTINIVLRVISELKAEGYKIRIKDLVERTGLSRSVFSKEHIREILANNSIIQNNIDTSSQTKKPTNRNTQISNLKQKLLQKDEYILKLCSENTALKDECALLRGKLFLLMQRQTSE